MEGKTLDEITTLLVPLTGMNYQNLTGPLRIVNMRHEWLVHGWQDNVHERRNIYCVAKKAYIDEYLHLEGEVHDDVKQTIRNFYGGEYFPE
jgi:hypothetical protein